MAYELDEFGLPVSTLQPATPSYTLDEFGLPVSAPPAAPQADPTSDPADYLRISSVYKDAVNRGSTADAGSTDRADAAFAAKSLARLNAQIGGGDTPFVGEPMSPADLIDRTPHENLMAADRYRQVYGSAVPVLGEDKAQAYAKDRIGQEVHTEPFLRDDIFADLMGMPKGAAFDAHYLGPAADRPADSAANINKNPPSLFFEGGGEQAPEGAFQEGLPSTPASPLTEGEKRYGAIIGFNLSKGAHEFGEIPALAAAGVLSAFGGDGSAAQDWLFKHGVDPHESIIELAKKNKPIPVGFGEQAVDKVSAMIPGLVMAAATKNPEFLETAAPELFSMPAWRAAWTAASEKLLQQMPAAEVMSVPGAEEAGKQVAERGGTMAETGLAALGAEAKGTVQMSMPMAGGGSWYAKALTGGGIFAAQDVAESVAAGQPVTAAGIASSAFIGAIMGQMHQEQQQMLVPKFAGVLSAMEHDPENLQRAEWVADTMGTKDPLWAAAELHSITTHGVTRDEDAFKQWQATRIDFDKAKAEADQVVQPTEAETATPEARATLAAAEELVGTPGEDTTKPVEEAPAVKAPPAAEGVIPDFQARLEAAQQREAPPVEEEGQAEAPTRAGRVTPEMAADATARFDKEQAFAKSEEERARQEAEVEHERQSGDVQTATSIAETEDAAAAARARGEGPAEEPLLAQRLREAGVKLPEEEAKAPVPEEMDLHAPATEEEAPPALEMRTPEGKPIATDNGIPKDLPAAKTDVTNSIEASINHYAPEPGGVKSSFEEVHHDSLPEHVRSVIKAVERFTGASVHIVRETTPGREGKLRFNGAYRGGKILLNENSEHPIVHVLAHEWTHHLKQVASPLYRILENEVKRQGRVDLYTEHAVRRGYKSDKALEELTADANGDAIGDRGFMERMAKENPKAFGKLADTFGRYLDSFTGKHADLGSSRYIREVGAYRTMLAQVMKVHEVVRQPELRREAPQPTALAAQAPGQLEERKPEHKEGVSSQEISTRNPTGAKRTEDPLKQQLLTGLAAAKMDPKRFNKLVDVMDQQGYHQPLGKDATPDERAEHVINFLKDNIVWLHNQMPEDIRARAKLWYAGAHEIAKNWSAEYGIDRHVVSGVLARFSPEKDWFLNVSQAKRVLDFMSKKDTHEWDPRMEDALQNMLKSDRRYDQAKLDIAGKKFSDLTDPVERALWFRAHDRVFHDQGFHTVHPEGDLGDFVRNKAKKNEEVGRPSVGSFAKLDEIFDAMSMYENPTRENISELLGEGNKIRNFYNNIESPNSPHGHTTIDTHAVAADTLLPLSGTSPEVTTNFGGPGSKITGDQGTYSIHHEAYRRAAEEIGGGILPREVQSITWEAIRGLFPRELKSDTLTNRARELWQEYKDGRATIDETRSAILKLGGGIRDPAWHAEARSDLGVPRKAGYPGDARGMDQSQLGGRAAGTAQRGGRGEPAGEPAEHEFSLPTDKRTELLTRAAPFIRARMGHSENDEQVWGFTRESGGTGGKNGLVEAVYKPTPELHEALTASGATPVAVHELKQHPINVNKFHDAITASKARNEFGAAVYVYPKDEYTGMRLFTTPDGKSGFAIKKDGDVVSGFTDGGRKMQGMLHLATELGGKKADCFDTVLPDLYAINGFRVVKREPWNEEYKPEGWDKKAFADFNHGEPDVVYLEHDPSYNPLEEGTGKPEEMDFSLPAAEENVAPHSDETGDGAPVKSLKTPIGTLRVETAKGQTRSGPGWSREMKHDYGYIEGVPGRDGGSMDAIIGEGARNPMRPVFVIHQKNAEGGFDEHKVMVGFANQRDAERAYKSEYPKGWDRMGQVEQFSPADFKTWAKTEGREQAQIGKVDPSVPRIQARPLQHDAVAMHATTSNPMPVRTGHTGAALDRLDLPNAPKASQARTHFDDAGNVTGTHQAVLRNLYDVNSDPRDLFTAAVRSAQAKGLPLDEPHVMNELENHIVAGGFDGYRSADGKAILLGGKVRTEKVSESKPVAPSRPVEHPAHDIGGTEAPAETPRPDVTRAAAGPREDHEVDRTGEGDQGPGKGPEEGEGKRVPGGPPREAADQDVDEDTAIRNAATDTVRKLRGAEPIERIGGSTANEIEAAARGALFKNPNRGREIAASVAANPRNISDVEAGILAIDRQRIANEHDDAAKRVEAAMKSGNTMDEALARGAMKLAEDARELNEKATVRAGTEWSNSGRARMLAVKQDESLVSLLTKYKVAAGRNAGPEERVHLKELADKIEEAKADIASPGRKKVSPLVENAAKDEFNKALEDLKKMSKDEMMTKECFL